MQQGRLCSNRIILKSNRFNDRIARRKSLSMKLTEKNELDEHTDKDAV